MGENGERIEAEVVGNLYSEGKRKVLQFNLRDISGRRRQEAQLQRLEEQTRQTQKMAAVGRLAGGIAHDFNNLLTAILGYCDFLDENLEDTHPGHRLLAQLRSAADRAALLTKQLLA